MAVWFLSSAMAFLYAAVAFDEALRAVLVIRVAWLMVIKKERRVKAIAASIAPAFSLLLKVFLLMMLEELLTWA